MTLSHGTLVCRGTPVENHCIKELKIGGPRQMSTLPMGKDGSDKNGDFTCLILSVVSEDRNGVSRKQTLIDVANGYRC